MVEVTRKQFKGATIGATGDGTRWWTHNNAFLSEFSTPTPANGYNGYNANAGAQLGAGSGSVVVQGVVTPHETEYSPVAPSPTPTTTTTSTTSFCTQCGTQRTGRFCTGCGAAAPETVVSPIVAASTAPDTVLNVLSPTVVAHGSAPIHPLSATVVSVGASSGGGGAQPIVVQAHIVAHPVTFHVRQVS